MPFRKKAPTRSSIPKLQRQIDDIRAGRTSSLNLSTFEIDDNLSEIPDEIRELEGLRVLVVGENEINRLPSWLGDLPHLEQIDASDNPIMTLPYLPDIRWGINAETIERHGDKLDPAKIYAISIQNTTTMQATQNVFDLGRSGVLRLSNLSIGRTGIPRAESYESAKADWSILHLFESQLDEFLESQPYLSSLNIFGCPLGRVPEPIRGLQDLSVLGLTGTWPETIPDWLFEAPALTSLSLGCNGLVDL